MKEALEIHFLPELHFRAGEEARARITFGGRVDGRQSQKSTVAVAVVMSSSDRLSTLVDSLAGFDVPVHTLKNCREARKWLHDHPDVEVVITDVSLSDGNWCDLLRHLVDSGASASVVVTAPLADEALWSEVLWRGAYDLLVEPYEDFEVHRIVDGAIRAAHHPETTGQHRSARSSGTN